MPISDGGEQHVDLHRKVALRKRLLAKAMPGPAYVPFVGEGDLALELLTDRPIYAADLDPQRVATARTRLPDTAVVVEADCDKWPFEDRATPAFAVADFDAYAYPYEAFRAWWRHAERTSTVVVFFTDTQLMALNMGGRAKHPDGTSLKFVKPGRENHHTPDRRKVNPYLAGYWTKTLKPWITGVADDYGYRVTDTSHYKRGQTVYWGAVLEHVDSTSRQPRRIESAGGPMKPGKWNDARRQTVLDALAHGETIEAAAVAAGVSARTVQTRAKKDRDLKAALEAAKANATGGHGLRLTAEVKAEIVEAVAQGRRPTLAARDVGVSRSALWRARTRDADFEAAMLEAEREGNERIEDAMYEAALNGNVTAQQVWLYNRASDRWRDRRNVSVTGADGGPVQVGKPPEDTIADLLGSPEGAHALDTLSALVAQQQSAQAAG